MRASKWLGEEILISLDSRPHFYQVLLLQKYSASSHILRVALRRAESTLKDPIFCARLIQKHQDQEQSHPCLHSRSRSEPWSKGGIQGLRSYKEYRLISTSQRSMSKLRQLTGRMAYLWSPLAYSILKTITAGSKAFNRGLQSSHGDMCRGRHHVRDDSYSDIQNAWFALSNVKHGGPGSPLNILLRCCNLLPVISNVRLPTLSAMKLNPNIANHRFHVIANHRPGIQKIGNRLEYLGIVILMWGSTVPSIYYGFYCDPKLQQVYWFNVRNTGSSHNISSRKS